jgi:hypothetical protein
MIYHYITIANPDSNSDVVAVALSFALLMCNLLHVRPSLSSYGSPLEFFGPDLLPWSIKKTISFFSKGYF